MMSTGKHVAVLTFPFSSHPRTITTLLLKMAKSSPDVLFSFFNTLNSNRSLLSSSSHLDWPSNIKIHNVEDGVPPGHQFSGSRREPMDIFLKVAGEILTSKIRTVAAETGINFTCIVTDAFLAPFACQIAENMSISFVPVWTGLPSNLAAHSQIQIIRQRIADEKLDEDGNLDFIPGLSLMRVKDIPGDMLSHKDWKESVFFKRLSAVGDALSKATAVAVTSFEELNPEPLNIDFKSKFRDFLNLGLIADSNLSSSDSDPEGCLSWLDRQQFKSVAYISFGTVDSFPDKELRELAESLEFSKIPFLWSLKDNLKEELPNGFVERTSNNQGKIVGWTPQRLVLGHDSVAVFISHAGYNAVRESIAHGVPMICRPVFGDQMMAARLVEEGWGIGVKVDGGAISRDGLLKSLGLFLPYDQNEQGKKIRENVKELKKVVLMASQPGGSAARDFNKFIQIISTVS